MKRLALLYLMFVTLSTLVSCSNDDQSPELSVVTTLPAEVIGPDVILGLNLAVAGDDLEEIGVVYSEQPNPVVGGPSVSIAALAIGGEHVFSPITLNANTTYYARAYADQGNLGIQYGNEITFVIGSTVTTGKAVNISSVSAVLYGEFAMDSDETWDSMGFVYGTEPNPTEGIQEMSPGGNVGIFIYPLEPNTHYYYRAYYNGEYGEQREFTTAGYEGQSGGYVIYDKGEVTDGWRYLEIHPVSLQFSPENPGSQWGDTETYLGTTSGAIGSGVANTASIAGSTAQADCAAKLCQDLVLNGYSDWFLGSLSELRIAAYSMMDIGYTLEPMWCSTEFNQYGAEMIVSLLDNPTTGGPTITNYTYNKNEYRYVYPMRRY